MSQWPRLKAAKLTRGMLERWRIHPAWRNRPRDKGGIAPFLAGFSSITFAVLGGLHQSGWQIPPNSLPWRPVDLDAPAGWIAHWQLNKLAREHGTCRSALDQTPLDVTWLPDRRMGTTCFFRNVSRIDDSPVILRPRPISTCGLTAALVWYQQGLSTAAQIHMRARLVRIEHLGTYACRNINSARDGRPSEHATANAIDIAAFRFADGRVVSVAKDYGQESAEGRFLQAAHDEACRLFNGVLGPAYNRAHANHFHLDMGAYRICS